ncbi:hydroxyphenylacetyl-CoA thioesterase PaaI [Spongiibacter sp. KMU-166]|uniref:Hydroxyphenylacetyl-CoA thioesterase PaaI n=1 Tax=Spongiibacter thalassae TaxID=2721624 RepID=A0ABX1GJR7_9GAMM|nr:hydroxyphenylacetyl-CoA thioesterase PaaI [Spongiibacter thalassae]NKI18648.1 hydroxyphenylacetyl-CoA thioesterase PaaI [Spongiibacter thalassae]
MTKVVLSPQTLAERCAEVLMARDQASRHLGMELVSVSPGKAEMKMLVKDYMVQGHGNCHGGYIFTLADTTFAFACNTYDAVSVAQGCNIEYVRPGKLDDTLTAKCAQLSRGKRTGVYDVTIENQDGELIALMRGKSYQVGASLLS